jgi:hypothetical protein
VRVDADSQAFLGRFDRHDPVQLDVDGYRGAGPRRFAADIDDVGAVRRHPSRLLSARSRSTNIPPSENESGVTFRMPITRG